MQTHFRFFLLVTSINWIPAAFRIQANPDQEDFRLLRFQSATLKPSCTVLFAHLLKIHPVGFSEIPFAEFAPRGKENICARLSAFSEAVPPPPAKRQARPGHAAGIGRRSPRRIPAASCANLPYSGSI